MFMENFNIIKILTIEECEEIERKLRIRRKEIVNKNWENNYKSKCEKYNVPYISLSDAVSFINFELNDKNAKYSDLSELCNELKEKVYYSYNSTHMSISKLTELSYEMGIHIWANSNLSKMICGLCICEHCFNCITEEQKKLSEKQKKQCIVHCNGYSCKECKQKGYQGYDWICEE